MPMSRATGGVTGPRLGVCNNSPQRDSNHGEADELSDGCCVALALPAFFDALGAELSKPCYEAN